MKRLRICATIEARLASTRLPGKVLFPLAGKTTLERIAERLKKCRYIDDVIVATTLNKEDRVIQAVCQQSDISCHRGSVENILERILNASQGFDIIVQATADNPFIDSSLVDKAIELLIDSNADFVCNNLTETYPRGLDIKVFTRKALKTIHDRTNDPVDLVHGSYYFYRNQAAFHIQSWQAQTEHARPELRLTVDEPEDYMLAKSIFDTLYPMNPDFGLSEIIHFIDARGLAHMNTMIKQRSPVEG